MKYIPSINYEARVANQTIDFLIIHYTQCGFDLALELLTDHQSPSRVSAHYLIDEDGGIIQLVDEKNIAWHAGKSYWAGQTALNRCSIGIELVNPGHGPSYRPFPPAQMEALAALAQSIVKRHPIFPHHVLGHSDIAPQRKQDPGELFDWGFLASQGIGIAPQSLMEGGEGTQGDSFQLLKEIGYEIPTSMTKSQRYHVVRAFQMHFYPQAPLGVLCPETNRRIVKLHQVIHTYRA